MRTLKSTLVASAIITFVIGCNSAPSESVQDKSIPMSPPAQATPKPMMSVTPAARPMATSKPAPVTLKFAPASIDAIEAGTKMSTTRKGVRTFPGGFAVASDGKRTVTLTILSATPKKLSDLTAADAKSDGSESLAAFKAATTRSYNGLAADDMVTVVTFRIAR